MKSLFTRFCIGLIFALPVMLIGTAWAQASAAHAPEALPAVQGELTDKNCVTCHADVQTVWETSRHQRGLTCNQCHSADVGVAAPLGEAGHNHTGLNASGDCMTCHMTGYDPVKNTWKAEGISCTACHKSVTAKHPNEPMTTAREAQDCGTCHTETFFEWQVSKHRESNMACVNCHDPHATTLKAATASDLCSKCHQDRSQNFSHTAHAERGLNCADCHLGSTGYAGTEGHAKRDHSFNVTLEACNKCHSYQMHDPATVHTTTAEPANAVDAGQAVVTATVMDAPQSVSPFGFATLSGLLGLAVGMVLAPWLEKLFKRSK